MLAARLHVLQHLAKKEGVLDPLRSVEEGVYSQNCSAKDIPFLEGCNEVTHHPTVLRVIASDEVTDVFRKLFEEEPRTFDYKWLRAMHRSSYTGAHVDNVYMSRGTSELYTVWVPFGDVDVSMGTLAICEGSHCLPSFKSLQA